MRIHPTKPLTSKPSVKVQRTKSTRFTVCLIANLDQSIASLQNQRDSMHGMIEGTLDRKLKFLKYENDRLSYKMDESLYYLLQKIQEVDKGPDPVAYMYSLVMPNLIEPGSEAKTSHNLFEMPVNAQGTQSLNSMG